MNNFTIYLASQSPRRKMLLKKLGLKFRTLVPQINEELNENNPRRYALNLAQEKVKSVEKNVKKGIIVGVDTLVVIDNKILGKPKNKQEAYRMIKILNNREHQVISGLFILRKPSGDYIRTLEKTVVKFRKLSKREILEYINTREPYDKAGGYGIQGKAGYFIESINGCYYNVVGLPLSKLLLGLKKLSIDIYGRL